MKSIGRILAAVSCLVAATLVTVAQTTLYTQNFGSTAGTLPAGWTADAGTGTWVTSTTSASSGYSGASASANLVATNGIGLATFHVVYNNSLSTVGYTNITVIWGARATATFTNTVTFEWSTDGSTWNPVSYTYVGSTTWGLVNSGTRIALPVGAEGASNLQLRWTFTQLNNSGNYRMDDLSIQGTAPLADGDGSAVLLNAFGSGVLNTTQIFPRNTSGQSVKVSVTGTTTGTLTSVSVSIPYQWTWSGSIGDVSTAGDGASLTSGSVSGNGSLGTPYVIQYSGSITNTQVAVMTISNLQTANPTLQTDNGNYTFTVSTAKAAGTLTPLSAGSPKAYVTIPINNIRDVDGNGVPLDLNTIVAIEGVVTSPDHVFGSNNTQVFMQDASAGTNVFYGNTTPVMPLNEDFFVLGAVQQFNGLTELTPSTTSAIIDNGAGAPVNYEAVTYAQLVADPEVYEGKYIAIQNLTLSSGTWPTVAGAANGSVTLTFTDPGVNSISVIIDYDTDVDGNAEPTWPMDIKGIWTQSDNTSPYIGTFTTYSLTPRYFASDFAAAGSLPVEMSSFTATANHLKSVLQWSTATESNNFGFDIERKTSTTGWTKIGFVTGAGTSTALHNYSYTDNVGQAGTYEYRIRQIDKNGASKYSTAMEVVVGSVAKTLSLGSNYPNPFNPATNIEFSVPRDGKVALKIYNILGQEIASLYNGEALAGKLIKATFDASRLPSGIYFSRLEFGGSVLVKRMMLLK